MPGARGVSNWKLITLGLSPVTDLTRKKGGACRGLSLIEVFFAGTVLGISMLSFMRIYNVYAKTSASQRTRESIHELERATRQAVFDVLGSYFRTNSPLCNPQNPSLVGQFRNQTTPSGIFLNPLDPNGTDPSNQHKKKNGNRDGSKFGVALARCKKSPLLSISKDYFDKNRGIYFCLSITANPGFSPASNSLLFGGSQVIGEFFYTNVDASNFTELACRELQARFNANPAGSVLGMLHYTFHWKSNIPSGTVEHSQSGVLARAS